MSKRPPWETDDNSPTTTASPATTGKGGKSTTPKGRARNTTNAQAGAPVEEQVVQPKATAAAAKLADEYGIPLNVIAGTGANGTISKGDVERAYSQLQQEGMVNPNHHTPLDTTQQYQPPQYQPPQQHNEIPFTDDPTLLATLEQWRLARIELESVVSIIAQERDARAKVIAAFFPIPDEGTNKCLLPGDWLLKASCPVNRDVDEAALLSSAEALHNAGISVGAVVDWKPRLRTRLYRELTKEQRELLDTTLTIKPGSYSLELLPPKAE